MIWNPFKSPSPPTIADSARHLSEHACLSRREQVKLRARLMCEEMGRPIPEALRR